MMLKTIPGHSTPFWIGRYLFYGRDGNGEFRALEVDSRNVVNDYAFWREMDETRRLFGKFMKASKGRPREYYHFILSPDEGDAATLEEVREAANRWVDENIGDEFQAVIVYHDDNAERAEKGKEGIVHAHVVVNSVNMATGAKLQIGKHGIGIDALADSAQEIARDMGLSAFDNSDRSYKKSREGSRAGRAGDVVTKAEERMAARGEMPFKSGIRAAVETAAPRSENLAKLRDRLEPYGYGVVRTKQGPLFFTPEGRRVGWKALGVRYGERGLAASFMRVSFAEVVYARYDTFGDRYAAYSFAAARVDEELARLQSTIDAYSVISREGVSGIDDFAAKIAGLREFGAVRRKDLYIANKAVERMNEQARAVRDLDSGDVSAAHRTDSKGRLLLSDVGEFGRDEWLARYRLEGDALLAAQADVDGTARRIDDLQKARAVAEAIFSEVDRRAADEREAAGGGRAAPMRRAPSRAEMELAKTASSASSASRRAGKKADKAPYWKLQIKRDKYREIARTSREYRANALAFERASDPAARMRPYADRRAQVESSMAAQREWARSEETRRRADSHER